jgi:glycerophosphoryl diester phosphodiesterase
MVSDRYLARARRRGTPVNVWTVNDPDDMRRMVDHGVNGIITNHPDILGNVLASA